MMPKFDASQWDSQILTAKDALEKIPVTNYVVKPLLVLPSLNLFYGIPGSLKTNVLMDLAVCLSLGRQWLKSSEGFEGFKVEHLPVLWVDYDSGHDILHERFSAFLHE